MREFAHKTPRSCPTLLTDAGPATAAPSWAHAHDGSGVRRADVDRAGFNGRERPISLGSRFLQLSSRHRFHFPE